MTTLIDNFDAMSADQVRKHEWTDPKLDELVAVKVLGRKLDKTRKTLWEYKKNGKHKIYWDEWHPSRDMNDAMKAIKKYPLWTMSYDCDVSGGPYEITLYPNGEGGTGEGQIGWDKTLTRAICIATLIAEKEKK